MFWLCVLEIRFWEWYISIMFVSGILLCYICFICVFGFFLLCLYGCVFVLCFWLLVYWLYVWVWIVWGMFRYGWWIDLSVRLVVSVVIWMLGYWYWLVVLVVVVIWMYCNCWIDDWLMLWSWVSRMIDVIFVVVVWLDVWLWVVCFYRICSLVK